MILSGPRLLTKNSLFVSFSTFCANFLRLLLSRLPNPRRANERSEKGWKHMLLYEQRLVPILADHRLASDHKYLRICDLCKELGIACLHAHIAAERERQAKTDAGLVPLCPLASMVPVFWR